MFAPGTEHCSTAWECSFEQNRKCEAVSFLFLMSLLFPDIITKPQASSRAAASWKKKDGQIIISIMGF
jgi:hypothetical protein